METTWRNPRTGAIVPTPRDPTPSPDDVALTTRLASAATVLDFALLDHLIVGEEQRYFSFREAGRLGPTSTDR